MNEVFFEPRKNVIVKLIESSKPRERYQADIVLLLNFVWDGFKYIFTMVDHSTKYGWVILLNDKKAETVLRKLKNVSTYIIFLIEIRTINEESLKNNVLENFVNRKELLESMEFIIALSNKEQWRYSIVLFKISLPQ